MSPSHPISYSEALKLILENGAAQFSSTRPAFSSESLPLSAALGRVTATNLYCDRSIPEWNNSAMDGFALLARDTLHASSDNPILLPISGTIFAGDSPRKIEPRTEPVAWEIMTGACLPPETDTILRVEDAQFADTPKGRSLKVTAALSALDDVRQSGEDFQKGDLLIPAGKVLMPEDLMAAAALGLGQVSVQRRPTVAILSTGSELTLPGQSLGSGKIFNSTLTYLTAALSLMGAEVVFTAQTLDDPTQFMTLIQKCLDLRPDVVLTTGAVSMGKSDFIPAVLADLGAQIYFHKIRIRPGKPNLFASKKSPDGSRSAIFSLPGNPVSTAVGLRFLVEPYLNALRGMPEEVPIYLPIQQTSGEMPHQPSGLTCFWKATVHPDQGMLRVHIHSGQASFMIHPLLMSNAWAVVPDPAENRTKIQNGTLLPVYPLHSASHEAPFAKKSTEALLRKNSASQSGCC